MLRAYAQLLRLPNVFTAWADVLMGWAVGTWADGRSADSPGALNGLFFRLVISGCLYCAGMVLNDYFDVEEDRKQRPHRPIPSGRISRQAAGLLGLVLVFVGCVAAVSADDIQFSRRPLPSIGLALAACVVLYDAWLKRTWLGPLGMGMCRFLNVLLGLSVVESWFDPWMLQIAAAVGVYIVGVTWFARTEATESRRGMLIAAAGVMAAGVGLAVTVPAWWAPTDALHHQLYPYLMATWTTVIGWPILNAIREPSPARVQTAVKTCILGLIGFDALLAFAVVGWIGLLILLLLIPALILGRWVYST